MMMLMMTMVINQIISKLKIVFDAGIGNCFNHVRPLHNGSQESENPYGAQNVQSHCDVISDIISIKNTFF